MGMQVWCGRMKRPPDCPCERDGRHVGPQHLVFAQMVVPAIGLARGDEQRAEARVRTAVVCCRACSHSAGQIYLCSVGKSLRFHFIAISFVEKPLWLPC